MFQVWLLHTLVDLWMVSKYWWFHGITMSHLLVMTSAAKAQFMWSLHTPTKNPKISAWIIHQILHSCLVKIHPRPERIQILDLTPTSRGVPTRAFPGPLSTSKKIKCNILSTVYVSTWSASGLKNATWIWAPKVPGMTYWWNIKICVPSFDLLVVDMFLLVFKMMYQRKWISIKSSIVSKKLNC